MPPSYQLRVFDTNGSLLTVLGLQQDIRSLVIEHRVNHVSTLTLGIYAGSEAVQHFGLDHIIEVRRRVPEANLNWYTEFVGFHRTPQDQITEADSEIFTSYSRGLLDLIRRRSIRYYAETNGSTKGPATADDIIKEFVRENAGSSATVANGRISDGVTAGLSIQADTSQAAVIETAQAWRNLLDAIRDVGEPNLVDFDVLWGGEQSPTTFEFVTYYPQLGTDRGSGSNDPFVFSPLLGNMFNPSYTVQRTEEVSSALVLGPGEGVLRDTTLITSSHTADSPWNLIEEDINASNEDRADALEDIGDELLWDKRPAVSFSFTPIQTPLSTYAKHYFLGDIVTGRLRNNQANVKIRAVTLSLQEGGAETIRMELEEVATA